MHLFNQMIVFWSYFSGEIAVKFTTIVQDNRSPQETAQIMQEFQTCYIFGYLQELIVAKIAGDENEEAQILRKFKAINADVLPVVDWAVQSSRKLKSMERGSIIFNIYCSFLEGLEYLWSSTNNGKLKKIFED